MLDLSTTTDTPWTVDVVFWLVDKSFVRQVADERFDLLESVRGYAAEHLCTDGRYAGSGEAAAAAAQLRHWRHFGRLDERAAVANGCVETSTLVVACRRAVALADAPSAIGAMVGAWAALRLRGPIRVGAELAALVRTLPGLHARQQSEADWVAGSALYVLGEVTQAHEPFDQGLVLADAADDKHCEARLLVATATQLAAEGHTREALDHLNRAHSLAQELNDRSLKCPVLNDLGNLSDHQGFLEEARGVYEGALALARDLGDRRLEGALPGNLGGVQRDHGRLDEARRHDDMALALAREVGDRRW